MSAERSRSTPTGTSRAAPRRLSAAARARARAQELGHRGALFPWRTINGDEASAYYAAGTAQYHINADIMYAMRKYVDVTGDVAFLEEFGAEMLVETARLWADLGYYNPRRGGKFQRANSDSARSSIRAASSASQVAARSTVIVT